MGDLGINEVPLAWLGLDISTNDIIANLNEPHHLNLTQEIDSSNGNEARPRILRGKFA